MASVADALNELGITEWVLRGEPTSEEEMKEMFAKVTGADSNGSAIESSDPADWGTTCADVKAKMDEIDAAAPMKELRRQRDAKIAESDWMGNSDVTMSTAWKTYRQSLRDITNTYKSIENVVWPDKPV